MNKHDRLYAILLILLSFALMLGMGVIVFFEGAVGILRFILFIYSLLIALIILTLILRFSTQQAGRVMTKALNCILLLYFPLGTALAIYGFMKVDKDRGSKEEPATDPTPTQ